MIVGLFYVLKKITLFKLVLFKATHLAYIVPSWYGSRISADCQQKLFFTKHDTGGDFY